MQHLSKLMLLNDDILYYDENYRYVSFIYKITHFVRVKYILYQLNNIHIPLRPSRSLPIMERVLVDMRGLDLCSEHDRPFRSICNYYDSLCCDDCQFDSHYHVKISMEFRTWVLVQIVSYLK